MKERRTEKRVAARMQVIVSDRHGNKKSAIARNISTGGIGLECDFSLPEGSVVLIQFTLPVKNNFYEIKTKARVAGMIYRGAVQKIALGLQFHELPKEFEKPLQTFTEGKTAI